MRLLETPTETAHRILRELCAALARAGRVPGVGRFRHSETIGLDRFSINVVKDERPAHARDVDDLPPELKTARPSLRYAYRAVRALRDERGPDAELWPSDVVAWLDAKQFDPPNSVDTVNHALRDLRTLRLVNHDPDIGWSLGVAVEPNRQTTTREPEAYASRMAGAGARRFQREGSSMKSYIWVPGEQGEYGLVLIDAVTEECIPPGEHVGEVRYESRTGRMRTVPAARGELLRVEGKLAVARVGNREVRTRVLGDWHLKGLTASEPEPASVS
jgi:hypothetical protein